MINETTLLIIYALGMTIVVSLLIYLYRKQLLQYWKALVTIILLLVSSLGGMTVLLQTTDVPPTAAQNDMYPDYDYSTQLLSTEAEHHDAVYPLDDAKYVYVDSGGGAQYIDRFYMSNHTWDGNITCVYAKIRIKRESGQSGGTVGKGQIGLRWNDVTETSTDWDATTAWITKTWTMTTNPWDSQPWNWTMLDEMEIQARLRCGFEGAKPPYTLYETYASYLMLLVAYDPPTLTAQANKTFDDYDNNDLILKTQWTTNTVLDYYWFEHNMTVGGTPTNSTALAFGGSGQTQWGNQTVVSDFNRETYEAHWIRVRAFANTTDEYNPCENVSDYFWVWIWKRVPVVNERLFGQTNCFTRSSFYYNGTATGGKSAIYVAYLNATDTTYRVTAFDTNAQVWTPSYVHPKTPPVADNHWNPCITKTPSGNLALIYGYSDQNPLNYTISTYSAKTESNLTKLITNWRSEETIPKNTMWGFSYPSATEWDSSLSMIARDGTVSGGNWDIMTYVENTTEVLWCYLLGAGGLKEWTPVGTTPYLREGTGSYINTADDWKTHEAFFIERLGNLEYVDSAYLNLSINAATSDIKVYYKSSLDTEWEDGGLNDVSGSHAHWTIDLKSWLGTNDTRANTFCFKVYSQTVVSTAYVYDASIWINYTGWRDRAWIDSTDPVLSQYTFIQRQEWNNTQYGLVPFYQNNVTDASQHAAYFLYTTDEGVTWKNATGYTQSWQTPDTLIDTDQAQCGDLEPSFSHVIAACLNDDGRIIMTGRQFELVGDMKKDSRAIYWSYNNSIGTAGTWTVMNMTYEINSNGDTQQIWGEPFVFYDQFYHLPAVWACDDTKQICKFVLYPNSTIWRKVYADTDFNNVELKTLGLNNQLESFECLTSEKWFTIGNQTYVGGTINGIFGNTNSTGSNYNTWNSRTNVAKFTLSEGGAITHLSFYCGDAGSANNVTGVIYDISGFTPNNLLGTTQEAVVGVGWVTMTFSTPVVLAAGDYYIGLSASKNGEVFAIRYQAGATNQTQRSLYDPFPANDPWTGTSTYYAYKLCVYCNYTKINTMTDDTLYLNKFTASRSGLLTEVRIYANLTSTSPKPFSQFVIYNSTWNKLGQTNYVQIGASSLGLTLAGNLAWTTEIAVTSGQTYWIGWRAPNSTGTWQYLQDVHDTNFYQRMCTISLNWATAFSSDIGGDSKTYMNASSTVAAYEVNILIRGLGKTYPTVLDTGWNTIAPTAPEIGMTIGQINASIWFDTIQVWAIIYKNATSSWAFYYQYETNKNVIVNTQNDYLYIFCNVGGTWTHIYPS